MQNTCMLSPVDGEDTAWATFNNGAGDHGIARFNGTNWSLYLDEDGGLISQHVNCKDIVIEPDGTKWFGTTEGVTRIGPAPNPNETTLVDEGFEDGTSDWSSVNNDGDAYTWTVASETSTGRDVAYTGDYGQEVHYNITGNDDWLLSTPLDLTDKDSASFSFWSRSHSSSFLESFNVKLSTTGTDIADFSVTLEEVTDVPNEWTQYTYDLSAYTGQTVYVAIQCVSVDEYYLFVDDIEITASSDDETEGWSFVESGTTNQLNWVHFIDENNGWIVGNNSTMLHTENGGSSWTTKTSPIAMDLYACFFVDSENGWAVGGSLSSRKIIHTSNGGTTWTEQTSVKPSNRPITLFFIDSNTGWIAGDAGAMEKTVDGGTTWVSVDTGISNHIVDIHFTDADTGWMGTQYGKIYVTSNGGGIWTQQTSGVETTVFENRLFGNMDFIDSDNGWVVGRNGVIVNTDSGGSTWTTQTSNTTDDLWSIDFIDANKGWCVGQNGAIITTTDGGTTWTTEESGTGFTLLSVSFTDQNNGWAVGGGGTILSYTVSAPDTDSDGIPDSIENTTCTDPNDADTDDDGINDGVEDANKNGTVDSGETNPCDAMLILMMMECLTAGLGKYKWIKSTAG